MNGCNAGVLWDHIVSWRAWSRSGYSIASINASLVNVCAAEREQLLFVLFIVQEAAIPLCDCSTIIADSYPWIIPMSLMCESFRICSSG